MRAIVLVADGVEDLEFFYPKLRLMELGLSVDVVAPTPREKGIADFVDSVGRVVPGGPVETKHGYKVDAIGVDEVLKTDDVDVLIIPGGNAPDSLRQSVGIVDLVGDMVEANKVVGAICHGPQVLISAEVVRGKTMTSWSGIKDDLLYAGAHWIDMSVVRDGNLVTSRNPGDLPDFMRTICSLLSVK